MKRRGKKVVDGGEDGEVSEGVDVGGDSPPEDNIGDGVLAANEPEEVTTQVIQDVGAASFDQDFATRRNPVRRSSPKVAKQDKAREA